MFCEEVVLIRSLQIYLWDATDVQSKLLLKMIHLK